MTPMSAYSSSEARHPNANQQATQTLEALFRAPPNEMPTVATFCALTHACEYKQLIHSIKTHRVFEKLLNRDLKGHIHCLTKRVKPQDKLEVYKCCSGGFTTVLHKSAAEGKGDLLVIFIQSIPTPEEKLRVSLGSKTQKQTILDYGARCGSQAAELCEAILHCFPSPMLEDERKTLIEKSSLFRQMFSDFRIQELCPNDTDNGLVRLNQQDEEPHVGPLIGGLVADNERQELLDKIASLETMNRNLLDKIASLETMNRNLRNKNAELESQQSSAQNVDMKLILELLANQQAQGNRREAMSSQICRQLQLLQSAIENGREFSQVNRRMATTNSQINTQLARDVGQLERQRSEPVPAPSASGRQPPALTNSEGSVGGNLTVHLPAVSSATFAGQGIAESTGTGMTTNAETSADLSDSASSSETGSMSPQPSPQAEEHFLT